MRLRPARPDEGPLLTALCLRSKAALGYDEAFMKACVGELTVNPGRSETHIMVAEAGTMPVAIAELSVSGMEAELLKLFVDPEQQGRGAGRLLLDWVKSEAARHGARVLMIDADPNASTFYERMGGEPAGSAPSGSIPGRVLSRYKINLDADRPAFARIK